MPALAPPRARVRSPRLCAATIRPQARRNPALPFRHNTSIRKRTGQSASPSSVGFGHASRGPRGRLVRGRVGPPCLALMFTNRWSPRSPVPACGHANLGAVRRSPAAARGQATPASLQPMLKRALDILGAGALLLLAAPAFALLALLIRADGGPAFYAHERVGRGGRRFGCLKFRSMVTDSAGAPRRPAGRRPGGPGGVGGDPQAEGRPARHPHRPLPPRHQPRRAAAAASTCCAAR